MENRMSTDTNPQAALYAALAKAQGEFLPIAKNREVEIKMNSGGKYKFRYADLEAVLTATRPAMSSNGLAVMQVITPVAGANYSSLVTSIVHKDGGLIESSIQLPPSSGGDIKNYGATLTYLRRYAYSSLLCVAADDDLDENGEEARTQQAPNPRTQPQQSAPQQHQPAQPADVIQFYPQEQFNENLPAWQAGIDQGRTTPERLIKMISSKAQLTQQQADTILAMRPQEQQQEQQQ